MSKLFFLILCLSSVSSFSQVVYPQKPFFDQEDLMIESNTYLSEAYRNGELGLQEPIDILSESYPSRNFSNVKIFPYAEYENQKYLIFNDEMYFSSLKAKESLLKNLPNGITPVVYTQNWSPEFASILKETLSSFLKDPSVLEVVYFDGDGSPFWSQDAMPVPVLLYDGAFVDLGLVDAKYYHEYEVDKQVAEHFDGFSFNHEYYFQGSNLLATADGLCAVVNNSSTALIPDDIFVKYYGCKSLIRFPYSKGLGYINESLKFIDDNLAITDVAEYRDRLEALGFDVILFPKAPGQYENYMSAVILKDTVYVPIFESSTDEEALLAYANLGYNVIPISSSLLVEEGIGSLHSLSVVYPDLESF